MGCAGVAPNTRNNSAASISNRSPSLFALKRPVFMALEIVDLDLPVCLAAWPIVSFMGLRSASCFRLRDGCAMTVGGIGKAGGELFPDYGLFLCELFNRAFTARCAAYAGPF